MSTGSHLVTLLFISVIRNPDVTDICNYRIIKFISGY